MDPISWIQRNTFFLEFSEGWALYAENPLISKYTDTYNDDPLTKYGMLKWQVLHFHSYLPKLARKGNQDTASPFNLRHKTLILATLSL